MLVNWDWQVTQLRHHDTLFPGFWGRESPRIIAVAREWFTMPHRRDMLAGLLPVRERVLGPEHPDTLTTRHQLATWTTSAHSGPSTAK